MDRALMGLLTGLAVFTLAVLLVPASVSCAPPPGNAVVAGEGVSGCDAARTARLLANAGVPASVYRACGCGAEGVILVYINGSLRAVVEPGAALDPTALREGAVAVFTVNGTEYAVNPLDGECGVAVLDETLRLAAGIALGATAFLAVAGPRAREFIPRA